MDVIDTIEKIKSQIANNDILLYMKGTPMLPMCGFSGKVVYILEECGFKYAHVNVLEEQEIRRELPKYANWPTFPQLYVKGELIGGCDIVVELYQNKELMPLVENILAKV